MLWCAHEHTTAPHTLASQSYARDPLWSDHLLQWSTASELHRDLARIRRLSRVSLSSRAVRAAIASRGAPTILAATARCGHTRAHHYTLSRVQRAALRCALWRLEKPASQNAFMQFLWCPMASIRLAYRRSLTHLSFTIVIQCPKHPGYQAKISPSADCKMCRLMFAVRNNANKVLSVPREERTDPDEILLKELTS